MNELLLIVALICSLVLNLITSWIACNLFYEWQKDEMIIKRASEILCDTEKENEDNN